jgi:hypothetical protein
VFGLQIAANRGHPGRRGIEAPGIDGKFLQMIWISIECHDRDARLCEK